MKKKTTTKTTTTPAYSASTSSAPKATPKKEAEPRTIAIRNKLPRMLVLNLDAREHRLKRRFPVVRQLRNGSSVGEMETKLCADSVTLLAREQIEIPATALASTDVQNAIRAGKIVVIENRAP